MHVHETRNLSQEQFSLLTEISQTQIARTELGQVNTSIRHVSVYAKFLQIDPKDLFDFSELD